MNRPQLTIGTRGSDLALYQAHFIRDLLTDNHGCNVTVKIIKTSGDIIDHLSFDKMEGKGFFTKELEDALLAREIDLAVHSLKDLMTSQPDGLKVGAVGYRADRREMLLIRKESVVTGGVLPVKADGVIGTSSNRRACQIATLHPSLEIRDLRGNVPTRIRKLREGQYDAIIIAAAGVIRLELDLADLEVVLLDAQAFLPAPGQGILGIQIRSDDPSVENIVSPLDSKQAATEAALERGLLARFDSGCSLPLGVYSEVNGADLTLEAVLGIRENNKWVDMRRIKVVGNDTVALVDRAFDELNAR